MYRTWQEPLMSLSRVDYTIIQTWFRVGKFLGFTPSGSKAYPVVLMVIYLGGTIFSFDQRYYIYQHFNLSQTVLDAMQGVAELVLLEFVVFWSVLRRNHWQRILKLICQMEQKINWKFPDSIRDSRTWMIRFYLVFWHGVFLLAHIYDSYVNWIFLSYSLAFLIFRVAMYYIMFGCFFVAFICTWMRNRYVYLDKYIKQFRNCTKLSCMQRELQEKLAEFTQLYKSLYLIVQEVNAAFGAYFFLMTICTVLEILNAFNYGIPIAQDAGFSGGAAGVNVVFWLLYGVCTIYLVMYCDSVGKSADKIWKSCLILHEQAENREQRNDFFILANYVKGLSPEFSAAGFWIINQQVLSTLFSSLMTYLIIIIQFDLALK